MKVTRLAKDRYIIAFEGERVTMEMISRVREEWADWWAAGADPSRPIILGGEPVEFVDFTGPTMTDMEKRLAELEAAIIGHKHS